MVSSVQYYSLDSSYTFTLLQSVPPLKQSLSVEYNPADVTRFLSSYAYDGMYSFLITNDIAT